MRTQVLPRAAHARAAHIQPHARAGSQIKPASVRHALDVARSIRQPAGRIAFMPLGERMYHSRDLHELVIPSRLWRRVVAASIPCGVHAEELVDGASALVLLLTLVWAA